MADAYSHVSHADQPVLTALSIGSWEWDLKADRVCGDAILASLLGHDAHEMARGMPMERFTATFHPDDVAAGHERRARVRERSDLFVWEHRVILAPGTVRWVLVRGHLTRDAEGDVLRARGICIDMTDSRTDGDIEGQIHLTAGDDGSRSALDCVVDQAIGLWELLDDLDAASAERVRRKLRGVLEELGRLIAASPVTDSPNQSLGQESLH